MWPVSVYVYELVSIGLIVKCLRIVIEWGDVDLIIGTLMRICIGRATSINQELWIL